MVFLKKAKPKNKRKSDQGISGWCLERSNRTRLRGEEEEGLTTADLIGKDNVELLRRYTALHSHHTPTIVMLS